MASIGGVTIYELDDQVPRFSRHEIATYQRAGTRLVKQTMRATTETMSLPFEVESESALNAVKAKVGGITTLVWAGGTRRCNVDGVSGIAEEWDLGILRGTLELTGF